MLFNFFYQQLDRRYKLQKILNHAPCLQKVENLPEVDRDRVLSTQDLDQFRDRDHALRYRKDLKSQDHALIQGQNHARYLDQNLALARDPDHVPFRGQGHVQTQGQDLALDQSLYTAKDQGHPGPRVDLDQIVVSYAVF